MRSNEIGEPVKPEAVQQSIFTLSVDMMYRYFPAQIIEAHMHMRLVKALTARDWGRFRMIWKYH